MTIVTYDGDLYYAKLAAQLINATWDQANYKSSAFDGKIAAADGVLSGTPVAHITAGITNTTAVTEPAITIPTDGTASDILSKFDSKYAELVLLLVNKFTDFQTTYFPNEATVYGLAETWVSEALTNSDYGIPAAVAAQLLTDEKSRAYAEAAIASDAVLETFAARRFPLPPGAAASVVLQTAQKAQDSISEAGRKLMMAYVENLHYAVDKALSMRTQALGSAVEYIKALASGPAMAGQIINTAYDEQSKLISAASSFYGARTDASRLVKQAEQFNAQAALTADEKNQAVDMRVIEERVKSLLTEAGALAQMCSSLLNNLHTGATLTSSNNATTQ